MNQITTIVIKLSFLGGWVIGYRCKMSRRGIPQNKKNPSLRARRSCWGRGALSMAVAEGDLYVAKRGNTKCWVATQLPETTLNIAIVRTTETRKPHTMAHFTQKTTLQWPWEAIQRLTITRKPRDAAAPVGSYTTCDSLT